MVSKTMVNSYLKALSIARKTHKNQLDLSGKPYILHPIYVSKNVKGKKAKIVALLHDTIEDGNITIKALEKHFSKDICCAIEKLTRTKNQSYSSYITNIKTCDLAKKVKIADIEHNMMVSRLNAITDKDIKRFNKYLQAYRELKNE